MTPPSKNIIIRVQSGDFGTKRVEVTPLESLDNLYEKTKTTFALDTADKWALYTARDRSGLLPKNSSRTVNAAKLKHGDMVFLIFDAGALENRENGSLADIAMEIASLDGSVKSTPYSAAPAAPKQIIVQEDDVDVQLWQMEGKVERSMTSGCSHSARSKCFNCMPLDPWDPELLKSKDLKFLSFHSYVRKMQSGVDKGKFLFLEDINCRIKPGCREHLPWPKGICTKCQPSAIVLNRQKYRHVDGIVFENHSFVDRFLNYWRISGCQRIGLMIGVFEQHPEVPLGIQARVAVIYEPPQNSSPHSVELLDDPNEAVVIGLAKKMGIQPIGWIFTDLLPKDTRTGTVECLRGPDSFFLSAEECILAAELQNKFPNPCKLSASGYFGSKFVTVVASGDQSNQIHFEAYQVSNQCMALVRDNCLVPTVDRPELGYVRESSSEQYVPDVFYMKVDQYGNQVRDLARPLPVEYLLLDLSATFPIEMRYTFSANDHIANKFPIENRELIGEGQSLVNLSAYFDQFPQDNMTMALNDFHVILYLALSEVLPMKAVLDQLCQVIRTNDPYESRRFFQTEEWNTLMEILKSDLDIGMPSADFPLRPQGTGASAGGGSGGPSGHPPASSWTCGVCTFENRSSANDCEMCGLPRDAGMS